MVSEYHHNLHLASILLAQHSMSARLQAEGKHKYPFATNVLTVLDRKAVLMTAPTRVTSGRLFCYFRWILVVALRVGGVEAHLADLDWGKLSELGAY